MDVVTVACWKVLRACGDERYKDAAGFYVFDRACFMVATGGVAPEGLDEDNRALALANAYVVSQRRN